MMRTTTRTAPVARTAVVAIAAWTLAAGAAAPGDWPQWRGPDRTGLSTETGLLKAWPATGPAQVWSISGLGRGYGSPAVVGDRIYVQGSQGKNSVVFSLKRADGTVVWTRTLGQGFDQDKGGGPRGTPTVDGDRVYVLSEGGDLACLELETGKVMWRDRSAGKGSLTYADGHLYLLGEGNTVGLAEATPKGYVETGRFQIADQGWPSWAHPTISQSQLLIRNQGVLTSYNIKAK